MSINLVKFVEGVEKALIESTLTAYNGNVTKAAEYLELNRTTLLAKIERFQIKVDLCIGYNPIKMDNDTDLRRKPTGLNAIKNDAILKALIACDYSRKKAASSLDISYRTVNAFVHDAKLSGLVIPDCKRTRRKKS
jgi:transcriptional regulator with PAS, ATPase and Fis domain